MTWPLWIECALLSAQRRVAGGGVVRYYLSLPHAHIIPFSSGNPTPYFQCLFSTRRACDLRLRHKLSRPKVR